MSSTTTDSTTDSATNTTDASVNSFNVQDCGYSAGTIPATPQYDRGRFGDAFARIDLGRLAFVPIGVLLGLSSIQAMASTVGSATGGELVLRLATQLLTVAFYVVVVGAYLRRGPARATAAGWAPRAAALAASWLPFFIPVLRGQPAGPVLLLVADLALVVGLAWTIWALHTLGSSFSIVPQARAVVTAGPYRVVRHPAYLGELLSVAGLVLAGPSAAAVAVALVLAALQLYRMGQEEAVLAATLPGYADYAAGRRRLVPALY